MQFRISTRLDLFELDSNGHSVHYGPPPPETLHIEFEAKDRGDAHRVLLDAISTFVARHTVGSVTHASVQLPPAAWKDERHPASSKEGV